MKFIKAFIVACLFTATAVAQSGEMWEYHRNALQTGSNVTMSYTYSYDVVVGTPFLSEEWVKGTMVVRSGREFEDVPMRFEAWNGMLNVSHNNQIVFLSPDFVREFRMRQSGQEMVFRNGYRAPNVRLTPDTYLQVLHDGEWSLFKEVRKVFLEAEPPSAYQANRQVFDTFSESVRYLARNPDGEWSEIRPRRRSINRFFGDMSGEVRSYIRRNDLDYARDFDLARMFRHASDVTEELNGEAR